MLALFDWAYPSIIVATAMMMANRKDQTLAQEKIPTLIKCTLASLFAYGLIESFLIILPYCADQKYDHQKTILQVLRIIFNLRKFNSDYLVITFCYETEIITCLSVSVSGPVRNNSIWLFLIFPVIYSW